VAVGDGIADDTAAGGVSGLDGEEVPDDAHAVESITTETMTPTVPEQQDRRRAVFSGREILRAVTPKK
jgi:hypothetical protein